METIIVNRICPICEKEESSEIVLSLKWLSEENKIKFKEAHNKTIGYGSICENCKSHLIDNYYYAIGIIPEKCNFKEEGLEGIYRSGTVLQLPKFIIADNQQLLTFAEKNSFYLIDHEVIQQILDRFDQEENDKI